MANRDIFSKHLPNVKLATRFDSDGNEIDVERREDADATAKEQETFDILVAAGYYRAKIKGLSPFDKVVGGMTWCIECCDYDVNVDLLFHENLSLGQKISLVEKIVSVLLTMKCPFLIEPHQIQGLEFISIHPVIQWLVKKSVENRAERAEKLKKFAIGQFHNNYQYKTDKENLAKIRNASTHIKRVQELYSPCRQYKRKEAGNEDEKTRVRVTLLEYGNKCGYMGPGSESGTPRSNQSQKSDDLQLLDLNLTEEGTIDRENDSASGTKLLNEDEKSILHKHYVEFKEEMETDVRDLSEQSQIKALQATEVALEKKVQKVRAENKEYEMELKQITDKVNELDSTKVKLEVEIAESEKQIDKFDSKLVEQVTELVNKHEKLKKEEADFKEFCRQDLETLENELKKVNEQTSETTLAEAEEKLANDTERLHQLRLVLAKKNRSIAAIQRQMDSVPDRTELVQYQRRFLELYNQVSAKHRETKQYYIFYNTLNDTKRCMEKEISILNSICENFKDSLSHAHTREQFMKQFEAIVESITQTHAKAKQKLNEDKSKRDSLNAELMAIVEDQRKYAAAVKQLKVEYQNLEDLRAQIRLLEETEEKKKTINL